MTKRPHIDWTIEELRHLTLAQLREQHRRARVAEARADAPGMGRSVKGRRLWRRNRELVEAELVSRGAEP